MIACVASYLVLCRWEAGATKGSGSTEQRQREEPTWVTGRYKNGRNLGGLPKVSKTESKFEFGEKFAHATECASPC